MKCFVRRQRKRSRNMAEMISDQPVKKTRDYMFSPIDQCREHAASKRLLAKEGKHQSRLFFPSGHFLSLVKHHH